MYSLTYAQPPLIHYERGTLLQLILTHCNQSKSVAYMTANSWYCTLYGFGEMSKNMFPSLWYYTKQLHCHKQLSHLFIYPHTYPWKPVNLFVISRVLPFSGFPRVVMIPYVAFSDWLLLLSSMYFLKSQQCQISVKGLIGFLSIPYLPQYEIVTNISWNAINPHITLQLKLCRLFSC